MRYIIVHRVLYLILCVASLIYMNWPLSWVRGSGNSMYWLLLWHALIITVVTLSMYKILRKNATDRTFYCEVMFSRARMIIAIFIMVVCAYALLAKPFGIGQPEHPDLPEIVLVLLWGIVFIVGLSPLSGFIWMPLLDIMDKPGLTYAFYMGFSIAVFLCLVFVFEERMFLRQLKEK